MPFHNDKKVSSSEHKKILDVYTLNKELQNTSCKNSSNSYEWMLMHYFYIMNPTGHTQDNFSK